MQRIVSRFRRVMSLVSFIFFVSWTAWLLLFLLLVEECLNFVNNSLLLRSGFASATAAVTFRVNKLIGIRDDNFEIARRSLIFDKGYIYICSEFGNQHTLQSNSVPVIPRHADSDTS